MPSPPSSSSHQDFLISEIMPAREVHLLAGPSGAGKSTLSVQIIEALLTGGIILGKQVPVPLSPVYVSCDRSLSSLKRALDRFHIPHDRFPSYVERKIPSNSSGSRLHAILTWVRTHHADASIVILDGFGSLVPGGKHSEYSIVADFLKFAQKLCEDLNLTILGIVHATKVRESEKITNPRQRILGSVAWAGFSDLIITIDEENAEDPSNSTRIVHVLPRDSRGFTVRMTLETGLLEELPSDDDLNQDLNSTILDQELLKIPFDAIITTKQLVLLAFNNSISRPSCERWLKESVDSGRILRISRGKYQRPQIQ